MSHNVMYHTQILQRRQRCLTNMYHTLILKRWQRYLTIMTLYHTLAAAATVAYHIFAAAATPTEREPATHKPASRRRRANPSLCPGSFHLATVLTAGASKERQPQRNQSISSLDLDATSSGLCRIVRQRRDFREAFVHRKSRHRGNIYFLVLI